MRALGCAAIAMSCLAVSTTAVADTSTAAPDLDRKSPVVATLASVAPAVAGYALFFAGVGEDHENEALMIAGVATLTLGPGAGHLYTRDWRRGAITTGIRTGTLLVVGTGLYLLGPDHQSNEHEYVLYTTGSVVLAIVGIGAYTATIGFDVFDSPRSARRYNRRLELSVAPTVMTSASGSAPGLVLAGTF